MGVSFAASKPPKTWVVKPSLGPSTAPAPSPLYQGPSSNPSPICRHHQHVKPDAIAPSPSKNHACDQVCIEPLTATPIDSPCGCVSHESQISSGCSHFICFSSNEGARD